MIYITKIHFEEIPDSATLVEAQRIYDNNLKKHNEHVRLYPHRYKTDAYPEMTLEEATRLYEENLASFRSF